MYPRGFDTLCMTHLNRCAQSLTQAPSLGSSECHLHLRVVARGVYIMKLPAQTQLPGPSELHLVWLPLMVAPQLAACT
jgi:hypothetical protein